MQKKFKRSYFYTQKFKNHEVELTYDLFYKMLCNAENEFVFYFEKFVIFIAFHYESEKVKYELTLSADELTAHYEFTNADELINAKVVNGLSIIQLWDDLSNWKK